MGREREHERVMKEEETEEKEEEVLVERMDDELVSLSRRQEILWDTGRDL